MQEQPTGAYAPSLTVAASKACQIKAVFDHVWCLVRQMVGLAQPFMGPHKAHALPKLCMALEPKADPGFIHSCMMSGASGGCAHPAFHGTPQGACVARILHGTGAKSGLGSRAHPAAAD